MMHDPEPGPMTTVFWRLAIAILLGIYGWTCYASPWGLLVPALFIMLDVMAAHRSEEYGGIARFWRLRLMAIAVTVVIPLVFNPARFWEVEANCSRGDSGCMFAAIRAMFPQ